MIAKMDFLKNVPYFTSIPADELEQIAEIMIERSYRRGMFLFMEGEPGEAIHFVMEGKVKIYKTSEDGREHILDIAVPGDSFAEVVVFHDGPYPASAEVIEDGRIAMIRNEDLEEVLKINPSIAIGIIKVLNKRLIEAQAQVKSLALQNTHSRTAEMLMRLADDHGIVTPAGIELDLAISRQELASMVGTTRETVTRILTSFKKFKLIDMDRNTILITDPDKLREWIG